MVIKIVEQHKTGFSPTRHNVNKVHKTSQIEVAVWKKCMEYKVWFNESMIEIKRSLARDDAELEEPKAEATRLSFFFNSPLHTREQHSQLHSHDAHCESILKEN